MPGFSVHTLGCKLNHLESESITRAFLDAGFTFVPRGGQADVILVNTCTVTSRAEQKARAVIRHALRTHPGAAVIVTGCYAQLDTEAIAALEGEVGGRLFVVKGAIKAALLEAPRRFLRARAAGGALPDGGTDLLAALEGAKPDPFAFAPRAPGAVPAAESPDTAPPCDPRDAGARAAGGPDDAARIEPPQVRGESARRAAGWSDDAPRIENTRRVRVRAGVKIQDGCDQACSFCRVRLARGPGVSLPAEAALRQIQALEESGVAEAVLVGVNIGLYRDGAMDLGGLLRFLLDNTGRIALRLSSLEPPAAGSGSGAACFRDDFFRALSHPRVRPHFHLSLQSLSAPVLDRMGRRYGPDAAGRLVARLREVKDDPFLAADLITGFPGETAGDFEMTFTRAEDAGFAWIHAFPFSRRRGTAAYTMKPSVPESAAVARVDALIALARRGRAAYITRWLGRTVEAVTERSGAGGDMAAVTENYLRVLLPAFPGGFTPGRSVRCRLLPLPSGAAGGRYDALAGIDGP
ncbi:MAG: radical SAM protein [Spirochaetaceae bacterium]|nr:radical SAM protein [Spirochaetaceae bacterium]